MALLRQAVKGLEEELTMSSSQDVSVPSKAENDAGFAECNIFIVHGRDDAAKIEVARLIERAGLNAVILHEMPNQGRTVAEKLEHHGHAVDFAIAILSPDDVGGRDIDHLQPRARQNVVGELFWFAGKLGRPRVCALMKGNVEIPSDFAGVIFTEMDERGAWRTEILRELAAAGYSIDWGKALA